MIEVYTSSKKTPLTNSNFGGPGWILVIFYFLALFLDTGLTADGAQIVIPALSTERGWNQETLLYWNSVAGYLALVAYIPLGIWAQKKSPRTQATILTVMAGAVYILLGLSTSVAMYAICLCLVVICSNGRCWISFAKLTSNWFPRKKGIVMGWTTIGNNASSMLLVPILSGLIALGGVRLSSLVIGVFMIITGILGYFMLRDTPEETGRYPDNISPQQEKEYGIQSLAQYSAEEQELAKRGTWTTAGIMKCKEFWIIAITCALMFCGNVGVVAYSTVRIQEFGFTQPQSLLINSVFAALACVGSVVWGWIDQKWGTKRAVMGFCAVYVVGIIINIFAASIGYNVPLMFVSVFLFFWCVGGAANWPVSLCASLFGRADFMKAQTPLTIIFTAGRMSAFTVIAFGMSLSGGSLDGAFVISGVLFVLAFIIMAFLNVEKFVARHPLS